MNKFLITGLIFLAIAAGLTLYFRQRSPHRSGTWTIEPGYGQFYALHASGSSRFLVKLRPTASACYAIFPIDAAAKATISFPIKDRASLRLSHARELDGPVSELLEFNPSPDYLFIYNPGPNTLTIAYDIQNVSG